MKKVAVFGNAGGGKSTLARRLAEMTGLPLYTLDILQYPAGGRGGKMPDGEYRRLHAQLLGRNAWIIDGYDSAAMAWERFAAADTLVYVDLPLFTHFLRVNQRFVKGLFSPPPGWPDNSPLIASTLDSYRVLWACHKDLTPRYRQLMAVNSMHKRTHHLKSAAEIRAFLDSVQQGEQ